MKKLFSLILIISALILVSCTNNDSQSLTEHDHDHDHAEDEVVLHEDEQQKAETEKEVSVKRPSKKEINEKAAAALEVLGEIPDYPESFPTLEDVTEYYHKANEAIGWIASTQKIAFDSSDIIEKNGIVYHRVKPEFHLGYHKVSDHASEITDADRLIYNLETFKAYLCTLINPEEVNEYMIDNKDLKKFVEGNNGALYALPFSYIPQGYSKDEDDKYSLNKNSATSYTFTVEYAVIDKETKTSTPKSASFDFVKLDGRWVFDTFRVIKQ